MAEIAVEPSPRRSSTYADIGELVRSGKKFPTIYADPPWEYANTSSRAAACSHYQTMPLDEICSMPIASLVTDNAHLHLWATSPLLPQAFQVIEAWGFSYRSCFVWTKEKLGMGNYWRVSHEYLLLGVRGSLRFARRDKRSWQTWNRTRHSKKPPAMRCVIESVSPGPYLELFGREEIPNSDWTVFGNQIERRLYLGNDSWPLDGRMHRRQLEWIDQNKLKQHWQSERILDHGHLAINYNER